MQHQGSSTSADTGVGHPLSAGFREHARILRTSRLSASLLRAMATDLDAGGPTAEVMAGLEGDPPESVPGLRLLTSLHRLVLEGRAPELAPYYPTAGGAAPVHEAWPSARRVLEGARPELARMVREPLRTNEPGRCALLYAGLAVVARRYGAPLRLLEIGAAAGVALRLDQYAYVVQGRTFGAETSPVRLVEPWRRPPVFDLAAPWVLADRRGCDVSPLNPASDRDRVLLSAAVGGDDAERRDRLVAALAVVAEDSVSVERMSASRWLPRHIGWPRTDAMSVVWHSHLWPDLDAVERAEISDQIIAAGERATLTAPFAVLGFESVRTAPGAPADLSRCELRLTCWPGGQVEVLATAGPDGSDAEWVADPGRP